MIYAWMLLLALLVLAPLAWALWRPARARGRREADLALFRAQLAELEAERVAGRLDEAGFAGARLEVQRRLLAAADATEAPEAGAARLSPRLLAPLLAVPVAALGLYLVFGTPEMPSATYAERRVVQERDEALLSGLRARLAQMPAGDQRALQGWMLLGNAERNRGNLDAAAEAYRKALDLRFEADTAAQLAQVLLEQDRNDDAATMLAEALARAPQHIGLRFLSGAAEQRAGRSDRARTIWQGLVTDAPDDAPWKAMVQRRLDEMR